MSHLGWCVPIGCLILSLWASPSAPAQESVVTVIADFEDDAFAASITATEGVPRADCTARRESIPARGQHSLAIDIGATQPVVTAVCEFVFREPIRFASIDQLSGFVWIKSAPVTVAFRVRDADGRIFECPEARINERNRWMPLEAPFALDQLKRVSGDGAPEWPLQLAGMRVTTTEKGRQSIYLDDLHVSHRVPSTSVLAASFRFNEPTRIYSPGARVDAKVILENRSQSKALTATTELVWRTPHEQDLKSQTATLNLPPSSRGFRSFQSLDFSETIRAPGLYRLRVKARVAGFPTPSEFETTIAVTPTNRYITRGRSNLFGVRTNLLREPEADQLLEVALARDLGAQAVMLEAPWPLLEPRDDDYRFDALTTVVNALATDLTTVGLAVSEAPDWLPPDAAARREQLLALVSRFGQTFGPRLRLVELPAGALADLDAAAQAKFAAEASQRIRSAGGAETAVLLPAVLDQDAASLVAAARTTENVGAAIRTIGNARRAGAAWTEFAAENKNAVNGRTRWVHHAEPTVGAGSSADAVNVLRNYIAAAASGVGTLFWTDLRDDDTDPAHPEALTGLVRRDFSPKAAAVGYMSAAGMLNDLKYDAPIYQTPPEFESALFLASDRQVGVLIPRANVRLPALLAPIRGVEGGWEFRDFDRQALPVISTDPMTLVRSIGQPMYLTLKLPNPQPTSQVGFAPPWIRVPDTVFADDVLEIVIEPQRAIRGGFYQLVLGDAPLRASNSAGALAGAIGQPQTVSIDLAAKPRATFEEASILLRLRLVHENLEVPLHVRPLTAVPAATNGIDGREFSLGKADSRSPGRPTASAELLMGWKADAAVLQLRVSDDKWVAPVEGGHDGAGDHLWLALAAEGAGPTLDLHWDVSGGEARWLSGTGEPPPGVSAKLLGTGRDRVLEVEVAVSAMGLERLEAGRRLRAAFAMLDDDDDRFEPVLLEWGRGAAQPGFNDGLRWLQLK